MATSGKKIISNILDRTKTINLKGIDFIWKYSNLSHIKLFELFEDKSFEEIKKELENGDMLTILKFFYVGIIFDEYEEVEFNSFMYFFDSVYDEDFQKVIIFLNENLPNYLDVKKKILIQVESVEEILQKIQEKKN